MYIIDLCLHQIFLVITACLVQCIAQQNPNIANCKESTRVDLVAIVDSSGSVEDVFNRERQLLSDVVEQLPIGSDDTHVALVEYASFANTVHSFKDNKADVLSSLKQLVHLGENTNVAEAFRRAVELFRSPDARTSAVRAILIITDGHSQNELTELESVLQPLRNLGVYIFAGSQSRDVSLYELELYTDDLNRVYIDPSADFGSRGVVPLPGNDLAALKREMRQFFLPPGLKLSDCIAGNKLPDVVSERPHESYVEPQGCTNTTVIDMVLAVDTGGPLMDQFLRQKALALELVRKIDIPGSDARVALIEFNAAPRLVNKYSSNLGEVFANIESLRYTKGSSIDMVAALNYVRQQFEGSAGSRPDASRIVLIITDGNSRSELNDLRQAVSGVQGTGAIIYAASETRAYSFFDLQLFTGTRNRIYVNSGCGSDSADTIRLGPLTGRDTDALGLTLVAIVTEGSPQYRCMVPKVTTTPRPPQPKPVQFTSQCGGPVDMALIIDSSGSVTTVFDRQKQIALNIVQQLPISRSQTHVTLIEYAGRPNLVHAFNPSQQFVVAKLSSLYHLSGSTNAADAFRLAYAQLTSQQARPEAQKVIVIITDGHSQNELDDLERALSPLHSTGVLIYAATESKNPSYLELEMYTGSQSNIYINDVTNSYESGRHRPLDQLVPKLRQIIGADCGQVTEAPKPPKPQILEQRDCQPVEILFVLDSSGSVEHDYAQQKRFMEAVVNKLTLGPDTHRVGVVAYSGIEKNIEMRFESYYNNADLINAIRKIKHYKGTTKTGEALKLARELLDTRRLGVTTFVICLTDGFSQDVVSEPAAAIRNLPQVEILAVGVTSPLNRQELMEMAGNPQQVLIGADIESLANFLDPYIYCGRVDHKVTKPQPTELLPVVKEPFTKTPIDIVPFEPRQDCIFDIVFVIDASGSVNEVFQRYLTQALEIVDRIRISPLETRVAAVVFAGIGSARIEFSMNQYTSNAEVKQAISNARYVGGTTAAGDALYLAANEYLPSKGARSNATPLAFILTDGLSQQDPKAAAEELQRKATVYAMNNGEYYNSIQLREITGSRKRVFLQKEMDKLNQELDRLFKGCR